MSFFIAYAKQAEAHIVTDSASFTSDGKKVGQLVKAHPLMPKMGLLCGVGPITPISRLAWELEVEPGDFDAACDSFQLILDRVWNNYLQENSWATNVLDAVGNSSTADGQRYCALALVGYSERHQSCVVFGGECGPDGVAVSGHKAPIEAFSPKPANASFPKKPQLPKDLLTVAKQQHKMLGDEGRALGWKHSCGGGDIVAYRVSKFKIKSRIIAHFSTELRDEPTAAKGSRQSPAALVQTHR